MKRTLMLIAFAVLIVTLSISTPNLTAQAAQPEAQPHMQAALERLREAQRELEAASHDKGGHRSRAVSLVKQAIVQVNQGIQYDSTHKEGNERTKPRAR
jgi:CubicO group peptidase (beta-lactamase class C family)